MKGNETCVKCGQEVRLTTLAGMFIAFFCVEKSCDAYGLLQIGKSILEEYEKS